MKHSRIKRLVLLTCTITCATLTYAYEMPVDSSLLDQAQPLNLQPPTRSIQRYELVPSAVDRRFTCVNPTANLTMVVEISHTNDIAHPATLQLINPVGAIESSFLVIASRLPRYPDVNLDSYKIRFGAELSTLVINAKRNPLNKTPRKQIVAGLLHSDQKVELINCEDELLDPNSLQALDEPFEANLAEVAIPKEKHPKSMCTITSTVNNTSKFVCSAVLIAPNLALTANHCLAKIKGLSANLTCSGADVAIIDVQGSVSNPVHDQEQWRVSNDIAILKLSSQITSASATLATLATSASEGADLLFTQTDSCGAFGYGNGFDGRTGLLHGVKFAPPPEELGGLTLTLENYQNERLITSDPRYFLRPGDSGGGVICNRGEEEVVVGIHSFSYPIDSTVHSASVGHNYQWLIEQIEKINGVTSPEVETDPTQDPNLIDQSAPIESQINSTIL